MTINLPRCAVVAFLALTVTVAPESEQERAERMKQDRMERLIVRQPNGG